MLRPKFIFDVWQLLWPYVENTRILQTFLLVTAQQALTLQSGIHSIQIHIDAERTFIVSSGKIVACFPYNAMYPKH